MSAQTFFRKFAKPFRALIFALVILLSIWLFFYHSRAYVPDHDEKVTNITRAEYDALEKIFTTLVYSGNPRVALDTLSRTMLSSSTVLNNCHPVVHAIGHAAFARFKDFTTAMKYQSDVCNSGYIHGVLESYLKGKDITRAIQTVCLPAKEGSFAFWQCLHGVGHGVMFYTDNNLPKSLELCNGYRSAYSRDACASGVFMENFNSDELTHFSKYVSVTDPLFPCSLQEQQHKINCYFHTPIYYLFLHPNQFEDALTVCGRAEAAYRYNCAYGVGFQTLKRNVDNPKFVEKICETQTGDLRSGCIGGMVGFYVNQYASLARAAELCQEVSFWNREACKHSYQYNAGLFNDI